MDEEKRLSILGNNICAERNRRKLSQAGLAELAGISDKHLSQIENGHTNTRIVTVIKIAEALNMSIDALCKNYNE